MTGRRRRTEVLSQRALRKSGPSPLRAPRLSRHPRFRSHEPRWRHIDRHGPEALIVERFRPAFKRRVRQQVCLCDGPTTSPLQRSSVVLAAAMPDDSMPSPQRRSLHTGEQNLLFASWPGDHLLDRAKRGDADLRRALVRVVKARTARVTVAVCEELADLDCAAFARKKFAPFVRGLFPVLLARLPKPKHDRDRVKQGGSWDGLGSTEHVPAQRWRKTFGGRSAHGCEFAPGRVVGTL